MLIALILLASSPLLQATEPTSPMPPIERCGWLIADGQGLREQPDAGLKPSDPAVLPATPLNAKAVYCERDAIAMRTGDQRVLDAGLPLIVRAGGREGVLQKPPTVTFDYHKDGERYVSGAPPQPRPSGDAAAKSTVRKPATKRRAR